MTPKGVLAQLSSRMICWFIVYAIIVGTGVLDCTFYYKLILSKPLQLSKNCDKMIVPNKLNNLVL